MAGSPVRLAGLNWDRHSIMVCLTLSLENVSFHRVSGVGEGTGSFVTTLLGFCIKSCTQFTFIGLLGSNNCTSSGLVVVEHPYVKLNIC